MTAWPAQIAIFAMALDRLREVYPDDVVAYASALEKVCEAIGWVGEETQP